MKKRVAMLCLGLSVVSAMALAQGMGGMAQMPAGGGDYAKDAMTMHHTMMQAMQPAMPTNDPDKDFAAMMIPHHQGAIDMAQMEIKYGKDPELRAMAEKIIADQQREIEQLRAWQVRAAAPAGS